MAIPFLLKPSEKTPSASCLLAELAVQAGLPENVVHVVHGGKPVVDQIIQHDDIQAISFVGSTAAGTYIHREGNKYGKRVQANLGAKNHAVVLPDIYRESSAQQRAATVKAITGAAFGAAGQRCMALSALVLVGSNNNDEPSSLLIEELVEQAKALKVGPGMDTHSDIGPLITQESKERICGIIDTAVKQGAKVELDGRSLQMKGANADDPHNYLGTHHLVQYFPG